MTVHLRSPGRLLLGTFLVFVLASLCTLRHDPNGWYANGSYEIHAERWSTGAPLTWLRFVRLNVEGAAPPMQALPEGLEYAPGVTIRSLPAALAVVFALAVAWLAPMVWSGLRRALEIRGALPRVGTLALFGALGLALWLLTIPELPSWASWILAIFPIPASTIAACWNRPRTALAAVYVASALFVLQIGMWAEDGRPFVDRRWDPQQDLVPAVMTLLLYVAIAAGAFALLRRVRRRAAGADIPS